MSDFKIEGAFDLDISSFTRGMKALDAQVSGASGEIKKLDTDIDKLSGKSADVKIKADTKDFTADVAKVNTEVKQLEEKKIELGATLKLDPLAIQRINVQIKAMSDMQSEAIKMNLELDRENSLKIKAEIKALAASDAEKVKIKLELDKDSAAKTAAEIKAFKEAMGGAKMGVMEMATGIASVLIPSLVMLATTVLPAVGVALGGAAGLVGMLGIAGAGIGAFAAFAIPAFKQVTTAITAYEASLKAVAGARTTAQLNTALAKQQQLLKEMNPDVRAFVNSWESFKVTYKSIAKTLEPQIFAIANSGLAFLTDLMRMAAPVAKPVAEAINNIVKAMSAGLHSEAWISFFDYIKTTAGPMIGAFGKIFGGVLTGIASLIVAFDPLTQQMTSGLVSITKAFANWAAGLGKSKEFQTFVEWMKINSPIIWGDIWKIVTALWDLGVALVPLGTKMLEFLMPLISMIGNFAKANPVLTALIVSMGAATVAAGPLALGLGKIGIALISAIPGGPLILGFLAVAAALVVANGGAGQAKTAWEGIKDIWNDVVNVGKQLWDALVGVYNVLKDNGTISAFRITFENLGSTISTFLHGTGPAIVQLIGVALVAAFTIAGPVIEIISAALLGLVKIFSGLPSWVQQAIIAIGLLGAAFAFMPAKIAATSTALGLSKIAAVDAGVAFKSMAGSVAASVGPYALMAGVAIAGVAGIAKINNGMNDNTTSAASLVTALQNLNNTGNVTADLFLLTGENAKNAANYIDVSANPAISNYAKFAGEAGMALDAFPGTSWWSDLTGNTDTFNHTVSQLDTAMATMAKDGNIEGAVQAFDTLASKTNLSGDALTAYKEKFPLLAAAIEQFNADSIIATQVGTDLGSSLTHLGEGGANAAANLNVFVTAVNAARDAALGSEASTDSMARSVDNNTKSIEQAITAGDKHARSLTSQDDSGRRNRETMRSLSEGYAKQLTDYAATGVSTGAVIVKSQELTAAFDSQVKKMGLNKDEAAHYKDALNKIPSSVVVGFSTPGLGGAEAAVQAYFDQLQRTIYKVAELTHTASTASYGVAAPGKSVGGPIYGPGTGTSDSINAMLSNGEFVINAASASKIGIGNLTRLNRFAAGGPVNFATGGSTIGKANSGYINSSMVNDLISFGTSASSIGFNQTNSIIAQMATAIATTKAAAILAKQANQTEAELKAMGNSRTALVAKIQTATTDLATAQATMDNYSKGLSDKTAATGGIAGLFGVNGSYQNVVTQRQQIIKDTIAFQDQITALSKAGLSSTQITDIVGQGATVGSQIAKSILDGGPAAVSALNDSESALKIASKNLGTSVSTELYGAGVSAAQGLVAGLQSQQDAIDAQMLRIARGMQQAIKNALGIHSPSSVMRSIGQFAGDGGVLGLGDRIPAMSAMAVKFAAATAPVYTGSTVPLPPFSQNNGGKNISSGMPINVTVKVQNPWTGEYHEQKMAGVVDKHLEVVLQGISQ